MARRLKVVATSPKLEQGFLTAHDWVLAAFDMLVSQGFAAVSVNTLAESMGVTRGSFYHHFDDRTDLLMAVLDHWANKWSYRIREEVVRQELDSRSALLTLARMIREQEGARYDAEFRAWAAHDPLAAKVVHEVDEARLEYIRGLFTSLGFSGADAECRARLFLYYEMSEAMMYADQEESMEEKLLTMRCRLLTE